MTGREVATRVHRAITLRYMLSLSAVALLSIVAWMLMSSELTAHRTQDETVGLAGAQRMLSHQMAGLLAERMATSDAAQRARADADLTAAERRFLTSFETLSGTPDDRRAAAALATAELRNAYYTGDNAVAATVAEIERKIEAVRADRMTPNGAADFIAWLRGPVISILDKAVAAHKAAAVHTLRELRIYQAVDIGLLLLVLMLEATFVFAPLARRVSSQTREIVATSDKLAATLAEMAKLASTDALTGLSNRRALDMAVASFDTAPAVDAAAARIGVISFDLDWFKDVNDRYGHAAGDAVLQAVGQRVRSVCRAEDFAARIGGDEFIVLLANAPSADYVRNIAERIRAMVCTPVSTQGVHVSVGASVGICLVPDQADDLETGLHLADLALRSAKRGGRSRCAGIAPDDAMLGDAAGGRRSRRVLRVLTAQAV